MHREAGKRRASVEARIASLQRGLDAAADVDQLLEAGNLILGFQYQIVPGSNSLDIPETGNQIDLDPKRSPVENAERYFKRYRKAREAAKVVPRLLEEAGRELAFVDELDAYIDLAETPADLTRLQAELASRFGRKSNGKQLTKQRAPGVGKILSVELGHGARAIIGRSARQNEEVTFKLAGRGDPWLHARDVPGAHVVVRGLSTAATWEAEALQEAASLAASPAGPPGSGPRRPPRANGRITATPASVV